MRASCAKGNRYWVGTVPASVSRLSTSSYTSMASSSNKWLLSCMKISKCRFGKPEKWEVNTVVLQNHLQTAASSSPPWPVLISLNCYKTDRKTFVTTRITCLRVASYPDTYLYLIYQDSKKKAKKEDFGARQCPNRLQHSMRLFINSQTANCSLTCQPSVERWSVVHFYDLKETRNFCSLRAQTTVNNLPFPAHMPAPGILPGLLPQR